MKFPNKYHFSALFFLLYGILIYLNILNEMPIEWLTSAVKSATVVVILFAYNEINLKRKLNKKG